MTSKMHVLKCAELTCAWYQNNDLCAQVQLLPSLPKLIKNITSTGIPTVDHSMLCQFARTNVDTVSCAIYISKGQGIYMHTLQEAGMVQIYVDFYLAQTFHTHIAATWVDLIITPLG